MSLTNPDSVVTEERLAQFYNGILPYLGGMPDVLANKFNKSDLYSTDEKIVGVWIDGKPLYQKTVTGTTNFDGTTEMASFDSTYNIVDMKAYIVSAEKSRQYNPFWYSVNNFWCMRIEGNKLIGTGTTGYYDNKDFVATIYFTKTNDSAVAIGSDTDYSTTEKIVGTWIDGKPIYQKTWDNLTAPASGQVKNMIDASFIDTLIDIKGTLFGDLPINACNITNSYNVFTRYESGYIKMNVQGNAWGGATATITLQYTKTS